MADQNDPTDQDLNKRPPAPSVVDPVHDPDTGADPGDAPRRGQRRPGPDLRLAARGQVGDEQEAQGADTEMTTGGEEESPPSSGN